MAVESRVLDLDYRIDWSVSLPGVAAVARVACHLARIALDGSPRIDDIEPVVSDLVAAAIRGTPDGAMMSLRILMRPGWARVEVTGEGPEPAIARELADRAGPMWAEFFWKREDEI